MKKIFLMLMKISTPMRVSISLDSVELKFPYIFRRVHADKNSVRSKSIMARTLGVIQGGGFLFHSTSSILVLGTICLGTDVFQLTRPEMASDSFGLLTHNYEGKNNV
ncbi:hypothetical protein MKW98_012871 [Papaver atlanticum]|uniref:Uncharacterized protein n=1 Tax=Papaver atlanticum TaxID=357466 RepID=A0AAD4S0Q2_9MAGN|nr:hypothetical protein MKW98_012871 [Papaver atlanticum]